MPKTTPSPLNVRFVMLRPAKAPQPTGQGAAAALPTCFTIQPWGCHQTSKVVVIVDETPAAVLEANQRLIKRPTIKGDLQHESAQSAGTVKQPIQFAVSRAVSLLVPGIVIVVEDAEWTPAGREHVPLHYSDVSATPCLYAKGRVIPLHSFALCDHGEEDGARMPGTPETFSADLALRSTTATPRHE